MGSAYCRARAAGRGRSGEGGRAPSPAHPATPAHTLQCCSAVWTALRNCDEKHDAWTDTPTLAE